MTYILKDAMGQVVGRSQFVIANVDGRWESRDHRWLDPTPGDGSLVETEADPVPVPTSVTMRQARLALLAAGKLADVTAIIAALPSPFKEAAQIEWEYSNEVQRHHGLVAQLAAGLGLDDTALNALFVSAQAL